MSVNHCVRSSASSSLASCSLVHLTYAFASLYLEKPVICDANTSTIGCSGWDAASAETSQPRNFLATLMRVALSKSSICGVFTLPAYASRTRIIPLCPSL